MSDARWERFERKMESVFAGIRALETTFVNESHNARLDGVGVAAVKNKTSLFDLMKRPAVDLAIAKTVANACGLPLEISKDGLVREQVELAAIYDGYLKQQTRQVEQSRKLESIRIPSGFEYGSLVGLSYESREKLGRIQPTTVGQASRIPGVRPTDIALLIGHLRQRVATSARSVDLS